MSLPRSRSRKSRLRSAFLVTEMLGDPQHIRDDLVRVATAIPNAAVRSRLMYSLAAHLMKANHSFEDIASTVAACGFPRALASRLLWVEKNVTKGA